MTNLRPRIHPQRGSSEPITGVHDPRRLRAVAESELAGHLGDADLNAVVATLRLACRVPIAVINVVSANLQTYPAEVGVGAPCTSVPDGLSFCAAVVDTGRPMAVADASTHAVYAQNPLVLGGVIGAYAGVPLVDNGFVLGSVSIFDSQARDFTSDDLEILQQQARLASSVLALRRSARTDGLTGLPNRVVYLDRLAQSLARLDRRTGMVAVMYLDIDGFKGVNDRYGHDVGDQVLVELATRLSAVIRPTDTLARFGGDEFVAVCEELATMEDVELLTSRMLAVTDQTWVLNGQRITVGVSIGVTLTASSTAKPAVLLREADAAMYDAKKLSGSRFVVATSDLSPAPQGP